RILVYRPTDAKKFGGTVIVEWLNVSGGVDANPDWTQTHVEIIREGAAGVGVSAQYVGVEGGGGLVGLGISLPLKAVKPARYGSLDHPGDGFSYDMFSQAAQAVRTPSGPNPLGDLKPKWPCPRPANTPDVGVSPRGGCSNGEEGGGEAGGSPTTAIVHGLVQGGGHCLGATG